MRPEPMRCVRLKIRAVRLPFRFAFKHATAERRENRSLIVELTTDKGVTGYGETIPREYLTGESVASCISTLREDLWPRLKALDFEGDERPDRTVGSLYEWADAAGVTAAYAALDLAIFDAWGKTFGVAGSLLLGPVGKPRHVTAPIGFGMPTKLAVGMLRTAGFKEFKVKVGMSSSADVDRLAAVRKFAGAKASIRIDANGGWKSVDEAVQAIGALKSFDIAAVEQPVARGDVDALAAVAKATGIPVVADESILGRRDAMALLAADAESIVWNLRVAKVGGITGVLRLADLAASRGTRYQLGALVGETSVLTAALRACSGTLMPTAVECAFPRVLLCDDPFRPSPLLTSRLPLLTSAPGLGVTPDQEALEHQTVSVLDLK